MNITISRSNANEEIVFTRIFTHVKLCLSEKFSPVIENMLLLPVLCSMLLLLFVKSFIYVGEFRCVMVV